MARELKIEQPFNLGLSLTMGQAFQWHELPPDFYGDGDKWFSGVLGENLIHIRQTENGVEYRVGGPDGEREATDADDELLRRYFRLDEDIEAIYASIARDPKINTIIQEFPGLRLLRQDPWECLVTYICSARNHLKHINAIMERMANKFGTTVSLNGEERRTFPSAEKLAENSQRTEAKLKELRLGLNRPHDIMTAAWEVCTGELDLYELRRQPYPEVRRRLMQCDGIGYKIADCICLFSLDQLQAFPMDRWVWRAITEAYPEWGFPEKAGPTDRERREVSRRAQQVFGEYSGYANQYLFYWRRQLGEERLSFADRWHGKFRITPTDGRELNDEYLDDLRYEYLARKYLS